MKSEMNHLDHLHYPQNAIIQMLNDSESTALRQDTRRSFAQKGGCPFFMSTRAQTGSSSHNGKSVGMGWVMFAMQCKGESGETRDDGTCCKVRAAK